MGLFRGREGGGGVGGDRHFAGSFKVGLLQPEKQEIKFKIKKEKSNVTGFFKYGKT